MALRSNRSNVVAKGTAVPNTEVESVFRSSPAATGTNPNNVDAVEVIAYRPGYGPLSLETRTHYGGWDHIVEPGAEVNFEVTNAVVGNIYEVSLVAKESKERMETVGWLGRMVKSQKRGETQPRVVISPRVAELCHAWHLSHAWPYGDIFGHAWSCLATRGRAGPPHVWLHEFDTRKKRRSHTWAIQTWSWSAASLQPRA